MKRFIAITCACVCGVAAIVAGSAGATRTKFKPSKAKTTKVSAWDEQSLMTSLEGDVFEIQGGKLAKRKSHNAAVIKLANRLIRDHTKSYTDGAKLARRLHIEVPGKPTPSEQWELQMLSQLSGHAFNHRYALLEVYDHEQDIQETTDEIKDGTNTDVRDEAKTELPVLRLHLAMSERTLAANR